MTSRTMPGAVFDKKLRLDAKNRLENYYFLVRTLLEKTQSRDELFGGDLDHEIEKAVQETSDWLDENQLARKDEFEARQKKLEGVVHPVMNEIRWFEYEQHMAAKGYGKGYGKGKSDELATSGPKQPPFPPPHHLLPAYGKGGSSSSSKRVSPYVR